MAAIITRSAIVPRSANIPPAPPIIRRPVPPAYELNVCVIAHGGRRRVLRGGRVDGYQRRLERCRLKNPWGCNGQSQST